MNLESIVFELSAIVVGAAVLATLFLYAKQPIILAYIAVGVAIGPRGFGVIDNAEHIEQIAHLGVILLLFLIGLHLQPNKLGKLFRSTSLVTLGTSFCFGIVSFAAGWAMGLGRTDILVLSAAMMFSSTVVALKLIPTTTLHQRHTGEVMTSVLLLQDILAILVILLIAGEAGSGNMFTVFAGLTLKLCLLAWLSFLAVRRVIIPLFHRYSVIQEYTFLVTLAWCLFCSETGYLLGLSHEMGAFLGGLSLASSKVALVIAEDLKPLREFFLILFFFAVGARFEINMGWALVVASIGFGAALTGLKIFAFDVAFRRSGESDPLSRELAFRLGQSSEFGILVAYAAVSAGLLTDTGASVIQAIIITSFILSTYAVVFRYPTPISAGKELRRD